MTFEDLKLKRQFLDAVEALGYRLPTPIQSQAIPRILSGQDLIGVAQTGTGKTGAYLLPILQKLRGRQDGQPRAVVLVPTKELALQVHRAAEEFAMHTDIRSIALVGGVGPKSQMASLESAQTWSSPHRAVSWNFHSRRTEHAENPNHGPRRSRSHDGHGIHAATPRHLGSRSQQATEPSFQCHLPTACGAIGR